jgi:hypothetical protein
MKPMRGATILLDNPAVKVWKFEGKRYAQAKRLAKGHPLRAHADVVKALKIGGMVEATTLVMAKYGVQYPAANEHLNRLIWGRA